jgi:PEP-CTERM motif
MATLTQRKCGEGWNMRIKIALSICGVALALGTLQARADGLPAGGTIIGVFSDPIYSGFVTHDPNIFTSTYFDNTATAPFSLSIVNSTNPALEGTPPLPGETPLQATGSKLQWGSDNSVDPADQFSELIFFGAQVPADIHQPFQAGVITFLNGTSDLTSLIFGASLKLYDNVVSDATYLGTDTVTITTTSNLGTPALDTDYINICGNGSNICGSSIEAYEDSQDGTGVTAVLMGQIVGDPQLQFTDVALAAVQTNLLDPQSPPGLLTGLVGGQAAGGVIPEPSTWAMMVLGFIGMGFVGYRTKRGASATAA